MLVTVVRRKNACFIAAGSPGGAGGSGGAHDADRHAARMAVQAGAGALISLTAGACDDIVMCSRPRLPGEHPADADGDSLLVRAALEAPVAACLAANGDRSCGREEAACG